jgi:lipopolysaccharide/colanic/teichoic acid biosynthesis glycosyltransferase
MATNPNPATPEVRTITSGNRRLRQIVARPSLNPSDMMQKILSEEIFLGMLCLDRKRAERSGKRLLLLLLDAEDATKNGRKAEVLKGLVRAANAARRETDPAGWYAHDSVLGIIFTEIEALDGQATINKLVDKVREALVLNLAPVDLSHVHLTTHVFGGDSNDDQGRRGLANPTFYPDLFNQEDSKKTSRSLKRAMDIAGSLLALVFLSPLFILIAVIVKLTSRGPVLFKQERLGQFGTTFTFLKFRSMYVNNDLKIHQEFMKRVISGDHDGEAEGSGGPVYKMTNDPRVTRIGRILRRTSLDELPQFLNVLAGDMSLVGPRPPLAYEYEEYDVWHRRRVLEAKPGITGLWQVRGRSRVRFDDMVRLDLQYVREWSLWLDLRILLSTPGAIVFGDDAF